MTFLGNLMWRRAIKSFTRPSDTNPVPDIEPILQAAVESPSSYGLQPWKIIVITDPKIKTMLLPVAYNQRQIEECTHLLVFCARKDFDERISDYVGYTGSSKEVAEAMSGMIASQSHPTQWAKHQAYIALGFALAAATERKIASCPMEGFSAEGFSAVLDLPHTLIPTVLLAIGIENTDVSSGPRFRFPRSDLIEYATDAFPSSSMPSKSKYRSVTPVRKRREKCE
jgi:nitroreductase/dihydropteridine reductase